MCNSTGSRRSDDSVAPEESVGTVFAVLYLLSMALAAGTNKRRRDIFV
jgi:hypothetical protein